MTADKPLKAFVFDMGGVLLRTDDRAPRDGLARRLGTSYEQLEELVFNSETARLATVGKITEAEHWCTVAKTLGLAPAQIDEMKTAFWAGDGIDCRLVDYIRSLRPGYSTGLLSNAWDDIRSVFQQRYPPVLGVFDVTVFSAEVGLAKPDPAIYQLILGRLQVEPEEAVFIDDVLENVEGARRVGMKAVRFQSTDQVLNELAALKK